MEATARSVSENVSRCFYLLLEVLARKSTRVLTKHLKRYKLPPRLFEIMTLIHGAPQNQTIIAEKLNINKNVMVRLIDELEAQGLCQRVQKPNLRRREYNIQLTAKGSKALRECEKVVRQAERELLSALTENEREQLCLLLEKAVEEGLVASN